MQSKTITHIFINCIYPLAPSNNLIFVFYRFISLAFYNARFISASLFQKYQKFIAAVSRHFFIFSLLFTGSSFTVVESICCTGKTVREEKATRSFSRSMFIDSRANSFYHETSLERGRST